LRLGAEFEPLWEAERAAENPYCEAEFEAAQDRSAAVLDMISEIPAQTWERLLVKARAVHRCCSGNEITDD